jgi:hypothetical protein
LQGTSTFNEVVQFDLTTEDGLTVFAIGGVDPSFAQHRQRMEFGAGLLLHLYRFVTKRQLTPVRFVHGRQHGLSEVSRYFVCKVVYASPRRWARKLHRRRPKTENCGTGQTNR